jgi:hypothetical protein
VPTSLPSINVSPFLYISHVSCFAVDIIFIPSCRPRPPLSPAQDCAVFYPRLFFPRIGSPCSTNDTSHAFASRTGIVSLLNSYKLERRSSKLYKRATVDISMKNPNGHPPYRPRNYTIHRSARRRQPCLFILPSIALFPPVLDNTQRYFTLPPVSLVGPRTVILDPSLS